MAAKKPLSIRQVYALRCAARGGLLGFGQSKITIAILQRAGLITSKKDALGYYNITEAGRAALAEGERQ